MENDTDALWMELFNSEFLAHHERQLLEVALAAAPAPRDRLKFRTPGVAQEPSRVAKYTVKFPEFAGPIARQQGFRIVSFDQVGYMTYDVKAIRVETEDASDAPLSCLAEAVL